ncbi:MAG: ABC transporter permease [Nitriliruptorales bacterium]
MASVAEGRQRRPDVPVAPFLLGFATVAGFLGLWEAAPRLGLVRPTSVFPFSWVAGEMWEVVQVPEFASNLGASATRWSIGLGLAIAIGVPLGILMGRSRALFHAVDPLLVVSYPVPKAALILLLVLWWGAGNLSQVVIIVIGSLIPIVISSYHGANAVEPRLVWSARGLGTSRVAALFKVVLPAALPQILSGLRLAIAISIFTLLASELLIRSSGIGAYMFTNLDIGLNLRVWALSVIIALIGFALDFLYVHFVRRAFSWMEGEV